jgi:hypothetical protein
VSALPYLFLIDYHGGPHHSQEGTVPPRGGGGV